MSSLTPRAIRPVFTVWTLLVTATVVSWLVGSDKSIHSHTAVAVLMLVVAFVKVRFVGLYFMELRDAPTQLRLVFEAYCLIACLALVSIYLAA